MSTGYNHVTLIGNLTREPELRYTNNGKPVCNFTLAVSTKYGKGKENTVFVDVVTWGTQAENSAEYLTKGSSVFIVGSLQMDQWEDRESGQKRKKIKVSAQYVRNLQSQRNQHDEKNETNEDQGNNHTINDDLGDDEVPF